MLHPLQTSIARQPRLTLRQHRTALLTTVAIVGSLAVGLPTVASAQSYGGAGGGPAGGGGGTYQGATYSNGQPADGTGTGQNASGDNAGGGGGGAGDETRPLGGEENGNGGFGGSGGLNGTSASPLGSAGFGGQGTTAYTSSADSDRGAGGGGAGGYGEVLTGTGPFSATSEVTGGAGSYGGDAALRYDGAIPSPGSSTGGGPFNYYGGGGGDGGAGALLGAGNTLTISEGGFLLGGRGGSGGQAYETGYGYGRAEFQNTGNFFGGNGGTGGSGVLMQAGSIVNNGGTVQGGYGIGGGDASNNSFNNSDDTGFAYGKVSAGNGGAGGSGITMLGAGTLNNTSSIVAGYGGFGGDAYAGYGSGSGTGIGGNGGNGGVGVAILAGGIVNNSGSITGGYGGNGGSVYTRYSDDGQNSALSAGNGGNGGDGIAAPNGGTINNSGLITGGYGGQGGVRNTVYGTNGISGIGGNGISGSGLTIVNQTMASSIIGGNGGNGIEDEVVAGAGGNGVSASKSTIINLGTIQGGNAGQDFVQDPPGGVGIIGSDLTIVNNGTIAGGMSSPAPGTQQLAIVFTGGVNSLTLVSPAGDTGIQSPTVTAFSNADTFALGDNPLAPGTGGGSFSVAEIGATGDGTAAKYLDFGIFQKTGASTWTLTDTTGYVTPWQILGGILQISTDANLGAASGSVTVNGGTLENTASVTSARQVFVGPNGGGLLTDAGTTLQLTGVVSDSATGGGLLTKSGTGTLELDNNNTYSGGTKIANGRVNIATGQGLGTGAVQMADGTTLGFLNSVTLADNIVFTGSADPTIDTGANSDTISGVISGAGALTKAGTGTLTLTGANTYSGGTTVAAGTLVGSVTSFGSGGIVDNAALVLNQPTNANFANPISGTGTLTKTGAGTVDLTGTNTISGATTIAQGVLLVDGSTANSIVTAQNGTTLGGRGTVGGIVAQSGSTISPGYASPYATLNVNGNVTFQAGSTYQVHINAAGQTDLIKASGTATINGGTVNVLAGNGLYSVNQAYTILTAAGGRSGTYGTLTTTSNLAFLSPYLSYDPNDVVLRFRQNQVLFPNVARTPNEKAAAAGIQSLGAGNVVYNAVLSQSVAGALQAFDATSGEIHASAVSAAIEDTRFPRESIFDRLSDPNAPYGAVGAVGGFGAAPPLPSAAQGYAPVHKGYDMPVLAAAAPPPPSYAAWGTGFGDFGKIGANGNAATVDRSLGGFILGVDTRIDGQFLNNWRIGIAGGYTSDDLSVRNRGSSGTFEMYYGGLYAGAQYGAIDIKLGALGGGTSTDTHRTIAFPGFLDQARSSYGGTFAQGFGELGYKIMTGSGYIEPVFQGVAIHFSQDGFREVGGPAALLGFGRDYDTQMTTLGFRGETALPFAGLPLIAQGFLGWRHAFGTLDPLSVMAFESGGASFAVAGAPIARDVVYAEAGLAYRASPNMTLGVNYSGQSNGRVYDNAVKGRLEYKF